MGATVELKYPVEADGRTISTLTMRRPKVRDERDARRLAGDNDAEHEIVLLANLCEVAPETIHELDLQDYRALQQQFMSFIPADDRAPPSSA